MWLQNYKYSVIAAVAIPPYEFCQLQYSAVYIDEWQTALFKDPVPTAQ